MKNLCRKLTKIDKRGFTLLELLVVFSIIAVASIFTAPYFQDWNRRSSFENSVSEVTSLLYDAKNHGLLKSTTVKIVADKNGDDYNFEIFEAATPITDCTATTTWTSITNSEVSLNPNFEILEGSLNDICFFRDGTTSGGAFNFRQKNGNTDVGIADISVTIATGFIDVIKN